MSHVSHAAMSQPAAPPSETAQPERVAERVSDLALARAAAQAVRAVPGVVDLSPGLVALAATYGSGQRVTGVVVHHLTPDTVVLEIHVVLSEAHCNTALAAATPHSMGRESESLAVLTDIANRIRAAVNDTARDIAAPVLARVDVLIDDLR